MPAPARVAESAPGAAPAGGCAARGRRSGSWSSRTTPTPSASWPGCSARSGHDVATAGGLAAALAAAEAQGPFDLVLSDIGLPDGTGLDLMRPAPPPRAASAASP